MSFVSAETLSKLSTLSPFQLDSQEFGVVKVDAQGIIQYYNKYESELASVQPSTAVGKNFFTEIAPCTNNRLLFGKFTDGVGSGKLDATIPYTFTYKMKPTNVNIQLYHDAASKTNWVLVQKR